jgi:hypothetical protein
LQVYLKAHSTLRDDMKEWLRGFAALYEASPLTVRLLLSAVASDQHMDASFGSLAGQGDEAPGVGDHIVDTFLVRNDQVGAAHPRITA